MARSSANRLSHHVTVERSWNLALLTPAEPMRRNRRTIDATALVLASLVTGLAAALARSAPDVDTEIAEALAASLGGHQVSGVLLSFLRSCSQSLIAGDIALRRRWALARDLLLAVWSWPSWDQFSVASSTWTGLERKRMCSPIGAFPNSALPAPWRSSRWQARSSFGRHGCCLSGRGSGGTRRRCARCRPPVSSARRRCAWFGRGRARATRAWLCSGCAVDRESSHRAGVAWCHRRQSENLRASAGGLSRVLWRRGRWELDQGPRARSRRSGHAATCTSLAAPRLP